MRVLYDFLVVLYNLSSFLHSIYFVGSSIAGPEPRKRQQINTPMSLADDEASDTETEQEYFNFNLRACFLDRYVFQHKHTKINT